MSATALPSLSQIENLDTRHLAALGADFSAEADLVESSFVDGHQQLKAARWAGQANDAALHRTDTDLVKARAHAEKLREAAAIARNGSAELRAVQQSVLTTVDEARQAGFSVNEDLSVSADVAGRPVEEAVQLQSQANKLTAEIRAQAATQYLLNRRAGHSDRLWRRSAGSIAAASRSNSRSNNGCTHHRRGLWRRLYLGPRTTP
ncbi:hypothetical protein [Mycobacterium shimoidei]|uniref:hypothetical protein n=1 Tax=Mycobacterium shimoidei TaxID=29313 RepID=UPI00111C45BF|nr:hypothetical protein [Mycobacterium shimoidei]MCV7261218.1 hypothetical protein [Mycobacterium shimoidei]